MKAVGIKFPFSYGKDVMVLTAMASELDKETAEAVANLDGLDIMDIAIKNAGLGRGRRDADCRPDRYVPGRFLATVTVPVQDPKGMGAMRPLQPLKASLGRAATLVRDFY